MNYITSNNIDLRVVRKTQLDSNWYSERIMMSILQHWGIKAVPQHIFFPFVVDFYLPEFDCIVEVNGPCHKGRGGYDNMREDWLKAGKSARQVIPVPLDMLLCIMQYRRGKPGMKKKGRELRTLTKKQKRAYDKQTAIDRFAAPRMDYEDLCALFDNHLREAHVDLCVSGHGMPKKAFKLPDRLWSFAIHPEDIFKHFTPLNSTP